MFSQKYLDAAKVIGGVLVGGLMVFTFQADGQVITVEDDGVSETSTLEVTKKVTQEVVVYSETLQEVEQNLTNAYAERDRLNAMITKWEAQKAEMKAELSKLPARDVPIK